MTDDRAGDARLGQPDRDGVIRSIGLAEMLGRAVRVDEREFAGFNLPRQETIEKGHAALANDWYGIALPLGAAQMPAYQS